MMSERKKSLTSNKTNGSMNVAKQRVENFKLLLYNTNRGFEPK